MAVEPVPAHGARDRVGLGYRRELAAAICAHLGHFDVLEILADDYLDAPRATLRALRTLGREVPLTLHGVSLGLASREPVEGRRLERLARLVDALQPESWSEHMAFVRGGGRELGHLAAPPRVEATVVGAARNVAAARRVVGSAPLLENVATLLDPPGSRLAEDEWVTGVLEASGAGLLLDLHNLYANAHNLGFDADAWLMRVPLERVAVVHLSGGRWLPTGDGRRRLDDHLHDVPGRVFDLLERVASLAPGPLTVVLERDGAYPPIEALLGQLDLARDALRRGRARRASPPRASGQSARPAASSDREAPSEALLAAVYSDVEARERFLRAAPAIDRAGLDLAVESLARKRAHVAAHARGGRGLLARLRRWWAPVGPGKSARRAGGARR